jgi:hypothetical protein
VLLVPAASRTAQVDGEYISHGDETHRRYNPQFHDFLFVAIVLLETSSPPLAPNLSHRRSRDSLFQSCHFLKPPIPLLTPTSHSSCPYHHVDGTVTKESHPGRRPRKRWPGRLQYARSRRCVDDTSPTARASTWSLIRHPRKITTANLLILHP